MARNAEKAQGLLNKWVTMKKEFNSGGPAQRRPYMSRDCDDLGEAEKWRGDVIREVRRAGWGESGVGRGGGGRGPGGRGGLGGGGGGGGGEAR